MTPEAQRVAIAEACGWKVIKDSKGTHHIPPKWSIVRFITNGEPEIELPDYLNSLDAMYEAEKVLDDEQLADMAEYLGADADDAPAHSWRILLRATPAQRAEAFLKTIGKWEKT